MINLSQFAMYVEKYSENIIRKIKYLNIN